jgi:ABC-2 type transport system ATP-binding protein
MYWKDLPNLFIVRRRENCYNILADHTQGNAMIETEGLTKQFFASGRDPFTAVDGVNLSVPPGQVLALLGPNGAGKTTTVRMLAAILQPTFGRIRVAGFDAVQQPAQVQRRVGVLTEVPGLYERMRGREYLDFFGQLYRVPALERRQRAEELLARLGMAHALDARIGTYSKGMKQKLAIVRAMLHDPLVLLLDEPTSAMDPHSARLVRDSIAGLRDARRSIIICTHNLVEAETLADRIAIIRRGQIIALGSPAELKRRLLGAPLMELRLTGSIDGLEPALRQMIQVEELGSDWVRYRTDVPQQSNPPLIRWLTEQGRDVITLSHVTQSLEQVYLQVVEAADEVLTDE